jgi:parallel beta-helix repeat protein
LPEVQSGESLETSPLLTVQPTTDGRVAQAYVESTLDPTSLEPTAQPVIVEEQPLGPQVNKSLSLFRYNKIALFTTLSALVAFAIIGGGSWFLSAHKANKDNSQASQVNNYNVSNLDLKEVNGAQQLQVKSAEYLTINGQLQVGNTLVLTPMSGAPSAPTTGQIYYDKATNQPYYYDSTKFISLAPQDIPKQQTIGAFVGTLQGQSGNLTLTAGSGISISGLKVSNTGVTGLHGTTGVIDVSNTSGDVTLSLPGLVPTAVVATDSSGHLTSLTAATPGLCLISTAGGPAFGSCTGSAQVTSVNSLSGALTVAAGSGISVTSNGTDTLTIASTASGVASLNGATGALTIANATQASGIITIQDATTAQKGLASFNGSDFSVASGAVSLASAVTKQGNSFNGSAQLIKLDVGGQASGAGQCLLSTAGGTAFASCPVGGNVSRGGAVTTNTIAKFDASGNIINSNLSDNGTLVTLSTGDLNLSAGALQLGGTTVITSGRVLQNVTADTGILTSGTLGVNRGGTGQSTFTDGQLLIGNSVGNTLTKATLTAGSGVSIVNGSGSITISAPSAGSCASCAATSLNNLAAVAINTSLLSGSATIDLGSNANPFRDLFLGGTATNNFRFTGVASAARTITVPDTSGTLAVSASGNIALSAGGNISFTGTLPVLSGGTGQTTFTDGQLLIGNSTGNTLTKATLTAGAGVTITNGGGAITIAAPAAGSCSTCANTALSNLTGVAINTSLLTGSSAIDLGSSANPFRDLYLGGTSTNNFKFTGTASAARTLTVPDASGTLAVSASGNIALSASGNITFTGQLPIANGGTNSNTAAGARSNLGAAASGANSDITSLTGLTSINPGAALTIGNTGQSLTLQGSGATTLTATNGGFTTIVGFATPTANVNYNFATASAGTYDICTTAGNCVGAGGGVTTSGGTTNKLAKFTGSSAIGDSGISDNGTTVNIQGTGGLDIGTSSIAGILDLEDGGGFHTRLQSGTLSGNLTFTLPTSNGSSGNCLTTNGSGTLSFSPCLSGSGAGGGVTDINGTSGSITLQSVVNQTTLSGTSTISIGTVQDIATSSSPTFAGLSVTSTSGITLGTGATLGKAIFRDGSSAFNVTLQSATISGSNKTITIPNATGTICLQSDTACGFQPAGSYAASGANSDITSLSGLTTALAVSEGGTGQSTFTDGQLLIGNSVGNTLTKATLTAGSGISITNGNGSITIATTGGTGVTGSGTNNTIAKFNGTGSAITDSGLTDNGTTLGYAGNVNFSGATSTFGTGNGAVSLNGNTTVTGSNTFTVNSGLTTLSGGATINGTTSINTTGTSNTTIGNGTGTFAVSSAALNITTAGAITGVTTLNLSGAITGATAGNTINGLVINSGALSGVTGITTNGAYTQSGTSANTFTGASTFSATGTALSVTNNATIGGTLSVGSSSQFQVDASGNFTTTGSGTIQSASGLTLGTSATNAGQIVFYNASNAHTTTLKGLAAAGQDQTITIPASSAVTDTVCLLTLANCAGAGGAVTASGGTQNYITKFSNAGATQIGNSLLYDNGSFVGLNTTTNSGTLSVVSGGTQTGLFVQGAGSGASSQVVIKNGGSSGDALQIQDSGGAPLLKVAATGELTLNTLGSSAVTLLCINGSNQIATCAPTAGTNSFILNGTSTQTANFNIQSALPGSIGGIIQGAVSQAADLLEFKNSGGSLLSEVTSTGAFQGGNATGTDVAGSALSLNGGQGTGTGNGGNILFKIFKAAGSTGSTNNTTASTVLTLSGTDGSALFKNATDSAKGFQVQNTSGVDILTVDTANGKFGTANQTTGSTNSNNVVLQSGNATGVTSNSGSVTIDSGTATGTAGNISIGTGAYTHNTTIGNSTGTSAITLQSGTNGVLVKGANTTSALQIQNASSGTLLNVDTLNSELTVSNSAFTIGGTLPAGSAPAVSAGANSGGSLSGNANTTYYYKVTAITSAGETQPTAEGSINGASFTTISAPTALTATASGTAGNPNGTYTYKVTYLTINGETSGGTTSASVSPASKQVSLTNIPTGPSGTIGRRIYRTSTGGADGTQKLVTTIYDNTTTSYTDNTADSGLTFTVPVTNTARTDLNNATVTFSAVSGATSYRVYRSTTPGKYLSYQTAASSPFTDTGAAGTTGTPPGALQVVSSTGTPILKVDNATSTVQLGNLGQCANLATDSTAAVWCATGAERYISKLTVFGHSYAYGQGASSTDDRFTTKLAGLLHSQENNQGVPGARLSWHASGNGVGGYQTVLQGITNSRSAAPYLATDSSYLFMYGINDLAELGSSNLTPYDSALRTIIARSRAGAVFEAETAANISFSGTWVTAGNCFSSCSGTAYKQDATNADTFTVNVPADFPGGTVDIGFIANSNGTGAVSTFTVDGSAAGSIDTRNAEAPGGHATGLVKRFTGLSAGAHTIVGTTSSVTGTLNVDYWQIESPNPPLTIVPLSPKPVNYSLYSVSSFQPNDADIDTLNSHVKSVVSEFDSNVIAPDLTNVLGKNPNYFASDGLHPNDQGYGIMAAAIYKAIAQANVNVDALAQSSGPLNFFSGSNVTFKNSTDSLTGFQVQNASGNTLFGVNTSTAAISIAAAGIAGAVQIGNVTGAVGQTIAIGNNATASSLTNVTIGSTIGASATTLQSGTSGITASSTATTGTAFSLTANSLQGGGTGFLLSTNSSSFTSGNLASLSMSGTFSNGNTVTSNLANISRALTASSTGVTSGGNQGSGTGTSIVATVTSQANRILIVAVSNYGGCGGTSTVTGVTYGGVAMTQVPTVSPQTIVNGCQNVSVSYWYLVNPASSGTVSATTSPAPSSTAIAYADFYNVDTTTPFVNTAGNSSLSTATSISVTGTSTSEMIVDVFGGNIGPNAINTTDTQRTAYLGNSSNASIALTTKTAAVGSNTNSGSQSTSSAVGMIGIALRPAPLSVTGAASQISSNCVISSGNCTDTSNLLNLNQQYASATGAVLAIQNAGTGADLQLGTGRIRPTSDSTTAIRIQNAAGTGNNAFTVDTTNRRVGINLAGAPSQALDVGGNVNISTGSSYMINGVSINTAGTLSNVAYLNQANSFSVAGTNTFTGTAAGSNTLAVVSSQTTATALSVAANSLTSGSGLSVSTTSGNLTSGNLISASQSATYTTSAALSNNLINASRNITTNIAGTGVQYVTSVSTSPYAISSNTNRLLIMSIACQSAGLTGTPAYNGTSMTLLNSATNASAETVYIYYLKESQLPAGGTNAAVTYPTCGGGFFQAQISEFYNVDQSTTFRTSGTASNGSGTTVTAPYTANSGDLAISLLDQHQGATLTSGGTNRWSGNIGANVVARLDTTNASGNGNYTYNLTGTSAWADLTAAIIPASVLTNAISGAVASFSSTCAATLGACVDSSNILNLNQQYASATGAVLALQNAGTGADIQLGGGTIKTADGTTTTAVNILSGNASGGASGTVAIKSGSGTTSSGTVTIQSGNASAGTAGNVVIDVGTSTSGGGTVNIGGTNATGVILARSGVAVTVAGTLQTAAIASNFTTSNALTLQSGNNTGVSSANTGSVTLKSGDSSAGTSGAVTIDSGTATTTAGNVSIGTGAYAHNVTIGNTTGTSGITLQGGSTGVTISGSQTTTNTLSVSNSQAISSTVTQSGNVANISRVNSVGGTITQDGSTVSNNGASNTLSITITDHGDNKRLLLVTSTCGLSPSFNGSSLTQLSGTGATLCFYYLKNPSIGTFNITGLSGSGGFSQFASSWYNVDQTNPIDSGASNANLSITASPTTTSDKVADYISSTTLTNTPGSGQTGGILANFFASSTYGFSTKTGTASTTTMSWGGGSSPTHIVAVMHPSAGALTVSGATASISSNCTITSGTCTDTSNVLNLNQQYASATGAVLALQNAGTGADIQLGSGLIQTAAGTTSNGITLQSGNASSGASGNITIDTGTFTSGTPTISIGTTNAAAISIGRSTKLVTFNGNVSVASGGYLSLVGGITSSRPASPTEGMLYYDTTTKSLLVYANGKWQADRSTATKIVADGSTSLGADGADYVVPAAGTSAQTTINSAITALGSTGGTVYLMEGTYTVDGSITIPSNVSLVGAGSGTVIKVKSSLNVSIDVIVDDTGVQNRIMVSNLKLDGNKTNNSAGTQNGINFSTVGSGTGSSAVPGGTIDKVWVENFRNAGMVFGTSVNLVSNTIVSNSYSLANSGNGFTFGNNTNYNRVEHSVSQGNGGDGINSGGSQLNASDNQIQNNTGSGISFGSGSYNTVSGNTIVGNSGNGVDMTVSGHNNVTGNTVKSNTGQGLRAQSSGDNNFSANTISLNGEGVRTQSASNNNISANNIEGNTGDGIEIAGSSSENISGNTVEGNGSHGIEISTGGSKIAVTGNSIGNNSGNGLNLSQSGGNNHINGNRFYDNGGSGGTSTINVPLLGGNFNVISNNTITDSAGTAYAIDIASSIPTGTYLSGNVFSGVGASKIHDTGTGTIYENQLNSNGDIVLKNNTGGLAVGTSSATNSFTLQGSIKTSQLSPPTNVSVTKQGTAGAVTYYYEVTALDGNGETLPSSNANLTNSNATLDTTNYNKVSFTPVPGAVQYKVYRATASGGPYALATNGTITLTSPASQVSWDPTSDTLTFFDQSNTTSGTISSINTTGISLFGYNVGIGASSAPNLLNVGTLTTAATGYQVAISTGGTTNSGIVVQTVASQSSGYILQAQDSTGATLASIDYQGNLAVKAATVNGTLTVNGHIVTGNTSGSTTASPHANAGTSATCTISGNDTGGQITLVTGSGSWAAGTQCTITFSSNYTGTAPHPVITPANSTDTSSVKPYVDVPGTSPFSTWTINFINADSGANTYKFNYFLAQ